MKLLFKQRIFSWFDNYDINDEDGNTVFTVEGRLAWGHKLEVSDRNGVHIATLKEEVLTFMPKFEIYINGSYVGLIKKNFWLFEQSFDVDFCGWTVEGDFTGWDYTIYSGDNIVATVEKVLFKWSDTYEINIEKDKDALGALMVVLAIDAEKCSRN